MIAENVSPTRRLSLPNQSLFFLPAFVTKIGKKTLVSSNWNPLESFDIAQERPTSDRARSNEDVQNRIGVFKIARSCPNTDRRVRNCTIALEI